MLPPPRIADRQLEWGLVLLIGLVVCVVSCVDPRFLSLENLRDILVRAAPTVIVSCGVMLVVVTAEIDISVGSLMALLATSLGVLISPDRMGLPVAMGAVLVLGMGTAIGTMTGLLVTWGNVPSILATLGLLTGLRGVTQLIMAGRTIDQLPPTLTTWAIYGVGGVPLGIWVAIAVVGGHAVLIHRTSWGRQCYAVGSSEYAARMSGLRIGRIRLFAFAYTGFLTAVATLVEAPRLPAIESGMGQGFELLVITSVVVGGVSIAGGRGHLTGVILAVMLMTMIRPALTFLDLGESGEKWTKAIQGSLILLAVVTESILSRFRRRGEP